MTIREREQGITWLLATTLGLMLFYTLLSAAEAQSVPAGQKDAKNTKSTTEKQASTRTTAKKAEVPAAQKGGPEGGAAGPSGPQTGAATDGKKAVLPADVQEAALKTPETPGDYIPCHFTFEQLRSMNAPETARVLSEQDAEGLRAQIMMALLAADGDQDKATYDKYVVSLPEGKDLVGLTPSQALSKVINKLRRVRDDLNTPAGNAAVKAAMQPYSDRIAGTNKDAVPAFQDFYAARGLTKNDLLSPGAARRLYEEFVGLPKNRDTLKSLREQSDAQIAAISPRSTASLDANSAVDAARKFLETMERPTDVGCAMSILSWRETLNAYGRTIANTYVAVQVVVRNLNKDQQFLVHDVEFATNADPTGRLGRYFSGRDKVVVRALSSSQQSFDPRNLAVNITKGITAIMSAAAPIWGGALVDAAGIANGTFVPTLDKTWKDLSTDQLNLLNDTGFSSAANFSDRGPEVGNGDVHNLHSDAHV